MYKRQHVVIHNYALRGGAAGPQGVRLLPHRANGPGSVPRSGTGPVTPRVPEEGKLRAYSRGLGPTMGVRDLPASVRSSHARRTNITSGGVRSRHVSRRRGRGRGSSAGRLAHPLHSMRVVEACSAAAARGAAFVRPHCGPRITKVHSATACAAPTQSPSAALIGYDGTILLHHAVYAASYTARSAILQATPQATPGAVSTRQHLDMLDGGFTRAGKEIQG